MDYVNFPGWQDEQEVAVRTEVVIVVKSTIQTVRDCGRGWWGKSLGTNIQRSLTNKNAPNSCGPSAIVGEGVLITVSV